jgi:hypothetical protein
VFNGSLTPVDKHLLLMGFELNLRQNALPVTFKAFNQIPIPFSAVKNSFCLLPVFNTIIEQMPQKRLGSYAKESEYS